MTIAGIGTELGTDTGAPVFTHPVAVCDIGGTNVRIAESLEPGTSARVVTHLPTGEHSDLAAAISSCLHAFTRTPRSLIVCAAGPIDGRRVTLTNANWTIDGPQIADALGLDQGLLLNDFEAQAIMLPALGPDAAQAIGAGAVHPGAVHPVSGTRLVLGPGTGLGAALLMDLQGRHMPLVTEAGHMGFAPSSPFEHDLWTALQRRTVRITGETLLSGPGTVRLYHALCDLGGVLPETDDPATITMLAGAAPDKMAAQTLRLFWTLVARYSGSLALGLLAKGGVTLSGGILPKLLPFLDPTEFRCAFEDQPPLSGILAGIPTRLATGETGVLDGLAAFAARPDTFMIDWAARLWR